MPPTEHKEKLPDMEVERQSLKRSSSSGKSRKKPVDVSGLELSPELIAIALGM